MKTIKFLLMVMLCSMICGTAHCFAQATNNVANDYLVVAGNSICNDADWNKVALKLSEKHNNAPILYYKTHPRELLKEFQNIKPRYVAIVEKPENIFRQYVIDLNLFSRTIDNDIYADFLWGIITGYDSDAAMKMVNNSTESLIIKSCVSTVMETADGKWFESYGYMDDQNKGIYGYKMPWENKVTRYSLNKEQITATRPMRDGKKVPNFLPLFYEMYQKIDPDLVITASHASEKALEMPFSAGFIRAKEGVLYAQLPEGDKNLIESGKRRVYLPIGNCLIGNIDSTKNSMAIAWMNSANVATFVGYVVSTWHGRNGWGGLKYFLTSPGRYTVAQSFYLNVQDMLYQMNNWYPQLNYVPYDFNERGRKGAFEQLKKVLNRDPTNDELGFWYDRDVLAYYGDPLWNVRLKEIPEENDFTVNTEIKNEQCIITINTGLNFDPIKISGDRFKQVHVLDLPFSYFFKERLNNPRLAEGQKWKVAVDENFILIYDNKLRPNNSYTIILDID